MRDSVATEHEPGEGPSEDDRTCLRHLGPALTLPQLWLAFHERNFLGNPTFNRRA